jgi:hypothetical protein
MFRSKRRHASESPQSAQPVALTPDETTEVSGGRHHKNDTPVGPYKPGYDPSDPARELQK